MQQRGLSGARGAHDCGELAAREIHVDFFQGQRRGVRIGGVSLDQAADRDVEKRGAEVWGVVDGGLGMVVGVDVAVLGNGVAGAFAADSVPKVPPPFVGRQIPV